MRSVVFVAALVASIGQLGCGAQFAASRPSCVSGPVARVGRPMPDEMFGLIRRELERAERAPPLVRARILEGLPPAFPDVSDLFPAPDCHDDFERAGIVAMRARPVVFSRELVARVRAVHDAKALVELATRDDASVTDYRLGPDEPGPQPPKSFLRYAALASIPAFWVADNLRDGRRLLLDRLRASTDARELLLLHGAARAVFEQALWGHPTRAVGTEAPALLRSWLPDLARRLHGGPDAASLELVLLRVADVGVYATRFGIAAEARTLLNEIVAAGGELGITKGSAAAARDLAEIARGALSDVETPQKSVAGVEAPRPRRAAFDARAEFVEREPAGGHPTDAEAAERVRDLDRELETLTYYAPRCYALEQLGHWLPTTQAAHRFDALLAPVFDGDQVRLNTETLCRTHVALGLDGVDEAQRAALAARLLSTAPPRRGERDHRLDEHGPAIGYAVDEDPVRQLAAKAIAAHPEWVDRDATLRAWLEQHAVDPIPLDAATAQTWSELEPAFERAIDFHLSGAPDAKVETARAILRAWMDSVRKAESAGPVSHVYVGEVTAARVRALGDRGRRAGIADDVRSFVATRTDRGAVVASYLLGLSPSVW